MRSIVAVLTLLFLGSVVACGKGGGSGGGVNGGETTGENSGGAQPEITTTVSQLAIQNGRDPSVLKVGNSYLMWYTKESGSSSSIYLARFGDDGYWQEVGEVLAPSALSCQSLSISQPNVIWDPEESQYAMYFRSMNSDALSGIYRATSADGQTWIAQGTPLLQGPALSDPHVIVTDERPRYRMWFTMNFSHWKRVSYATSGNGITFNFQGGVLDSWADDPCVVLENNGYEMYFVKESLLWKTELSPTGNFWYLSGPLMESIVGQSPSVLIDGDVRRLWYTATDEAGVPSIIGITLS